MGLQREAHVTFKNILRCSSLAALPQLLPLGVARLTYADINLAVDYSVILVDISGPSLD